MNAPQGSEPWKLDRCGNATASRFADALTFLKSGQESAARIGYRVDLVTERLTGRPRDAFQTFSMRQGIEREPEGKAVYAAISGVELQEVGYLPHPTIPGVGASPDALVGNDGGLELKCPEAHTHVGYLLDLESGPEQYKRQIQGALMVTGRAWWDWASYNPDMPTNLQMLIVRVYRDEAYIRDMERQLAEFVASVDELEARLRGM